MQPENTDIRAQKIRQFILTYIVFILICLFFFYWAFFRIPAVYQHDRTLAVTRLNAFLNNTAKADALVVQIQSKTNIRQKSMVDFYEWINALKEAYPQPFFQCVLNSYLKRVDEIENARQKDTSLLGLEQRYKTIKAETTALLAQNAALKQELAEKKQNNR